MNQMNKVWEMLGVEVFEQFNIKEAYPNALVTIRNPYYFTDEGVINNMGVLDKEILTDLIVGSLLIEKIVTEDSNKAVDNFKCRAKTGGYCNKWVRECVGWNNCQLKGYGAPCPYCEYSSPLAREECEKCTHKPWKVDNYVE